MGVPSKVRHKKRPTAPPSVLHAPALQSPFSLSKLSGAPALRRSPGGAPKGWSKSDIIKIQTQLRRLGLYPYRRNGRRISVDGVWGDSTSSGLVEAFGDYSWQSLSSAKVIAQLKTAVKPTGTKGQHRFRYGEMFSDKWLEMTVTVGFDEGGAHTWKRNGIVDYLIKTEGFKHLKGAKALAAHRDINKDTGKSGGSTYGDVLIKKDALLYKPPAGKARKISIAVYLVTSSGIAIGEKAKNAMLTGMARSDVSFYTGHGRYGSGPDFDNNFARFDLLDSGGKVTKTFFNYKKLKSHLSKEGAPHKRGAWSQFLWRLRNKRIKVTLSNKGNLYINSRNKRSGSFGANLIFWALKQKTGGGTLITGKGGPLETQVKGAAKDRPYRMWVFAGCTTRDYVSALRATPGVDSHSTDMIVTKRSVKTYSAVDTFKEFFAELTKMSSVEVMLKQINSKNNGSQYSPYTYDGMGDNPTIP